MRQMNYPVSGEQYCEQRKLFGSKNCLVTLVDVYAMDTVGTFLCQPLEPFKTICINSVLKGLMR